MKKAFALLAILTCTISMALCASAEATYNAQRTISKATSTPVIDGTMSDGEWDTATVCVMDTDSTTRVAGDSVSCPTARYYWLWDENGLYFCGDVQDETSSGITHLKGDGTYDSGDGIQLQIYPNNGTETFYHWTLTICEDGSVGVGERNIYGDGTNCVDVSTVTAAAVQNGTAYTIEAFFPVSCMGQVPSGSGSEFGLTNALMDHDGNTQSVWADSAWSDESQTNTYTLTDDVPVTGIAFNQTPPYRLTYRDIGKTYTLSIEVYPANATNKNVVWTSSQPDVISVDQSGRITVKKAGYSRVTATTVDGGYTAITDMNVLYYIDEDEVGSVAFDVWSIHNIWSPDGVWSDREYTEIPVDRAWISAWAETEVDVEDAKELPFTLGMSWDTKYVYTYIQYKNESGHTNALTEDAYGIWVQDCVQAAFTEDGQSGFDTLEYGMAHSTAADKLLKYVWADYLSSGFTPTEDDFICVANGNTLIYEFRTPFSAFSNKAPAVGQTYRTCFILSRYLNGHTAHTQLASGCSGFMKAADRFASFTLQSNNNDVDVTITSTPNKQTVRAGDTISYDLTMSGSYDGFSFIVRPPEGMSITAIEAGDAIGGQTINVDKFEDDFWMISILPGCSQVKSADTRIATVTLYVNEGIAPGNRSDIFPSSDEAIVTNQYGDSVYSMNVFTKSYTVIKSIPGDVNGDGVLDYYDVTKLYSCYRRQTVIDNELVKDINGDNTFNYLDIAKLYAMLREQTA